MPAYYRPHLSVLFQVNLNEINYLAYCRVDTISFRFTLNYLQILT